MSDKKKGFQPPATGAPGSSTSSSTGPSTGQSTGTPTSANPAAGSRSAARRSGAPVKVSPQPASPLERYRVLIIVGAVAVGLIALAAVFMQSANAAPYTCTTLMTPGPAAPAPAAPAATVAPGASTAPGAATVAPGASTAPAASGAPGTTPAATPTPVPTPRLGFVAQDMGQGHVSESTSVTYAYCPPTSGQHFNSKTAPLPRRFYGPDDIVRPGNWLHNLEHGYAVILYKGEPDAATLDQLRTIMDEAPGTSFSTEQCGLPNKVLVVRFDDMTTPFAAVSWDHALLLPTFDPQQLATYVAQSQETDVWPEKGVC